MPAIERSDSEAPQRRIDRGAAALATVVALILYAYVLSEPQRTETNNPTPHSESGELQSGQIFKLPEPLKAIFPKQ